MIRLTILVFFILLQSAFFGQNITLVDLNIRYDNPADGKNAWSERKKTTLSWLKDQAPDLYFFQEVLHHQYIDLQEQLTGYQSYGVGREDGQEKGEYSPVFFKTNRFELKDTLTIWLSPNPTFPSKGWDAACERIATVVILNDKLDNKTLVCINTHWDHMGKIAQQKSAEMIRTLIELSPATFQILGGDFNVTAAHPGIQDLTQQLHLLKNDDPRNTYHGFSDEVSKSMGAIDMVFSSEDLKATKLEYFRHSSEGVLLSDHDAIYVEWVKIKND
jgi:endonuclease/exonuclease/phosphatase family metal-dependent hydrolase